MGSVEEYIWVANEDACPVCRDLDGYTGTLEEFKTRVLPGIHKGCRCRLEKTGIVDTGSARPPVRRRRPRPQPRPPRHPGDLADAVADSTAALKPQAESPKPDRMF